MDTKNTQKSIGTKQGLTALLMALAVSLIIFVIAWGATEFAYADDGHDLPSFTACFHKETYVTVSRKATCNEAGQEDVICQNCGTVLESRELSSLEHAFGEYVITIVPTLEENGVETRTCELCGTEESRPFVCEHEHTHNVVVSEASCTENYQCDSVCDRCGCVCGSVMLGAYGHSYEYKVISTPTESSNGLVARVCIMCGEETIIEYSSQDP